MSLPQVVIRCSASTQSGLGHLIRCQAMAETIRRVKPDITPVFALESAALPLVNTLADFNFPIITLPETCPPYSVEEGHILATDTPNTLFILDSYAANTAYENTLAEHGKLLCFDDGDRIQRHSPANWLLNSAPNSTAQQYKHLAATIWSGPEYHPLRHSILSFKNHPPTKRTRTLVMFGGSDPLGLSISALYLLREQPQLSVITGPGVKNYKVVSKEAATLKASHYHAPRSVAQLFSETKWALTAAGSSVYELIALGVPFCAVQIADNQKTLCDWLRSQEVEVLQPEQLQQMAHYSCPEFSPRLPQINIGGKLEVALQSILSNL